MWLGERGVWRPKSRALCSANRHTVCLTSSLTFNVRLRVGRGPKGRVTVRPRCPLPPGCLENLTHLRPSAPKKTDWLSWASGRPAGSRERRMHACARCSAPVIPGDPTFAQLREAPQTGGPDFVHFAVTSWGHWVVFRPFSSSQVAGTILVPASPARCNVTGEAKPRVTLPPRRPQIHPVQGAQLPAHSGGRPVFSKDFCTSHRLKKNEIFQHVSSLFSGDESVSSRFFWFFSL